MSLDELCSVCGEEVIARSSCPQCKKVKQWLCRICGSSMEQSHDQCLGVKLPIFERGRREIIHFSNINIRKNRKQLFRKKLNFRIIGILALGLSIASFLFLR